MGGLPTELQCSRCEKLLPKKQFSKRMLTLVQNGARAEVRCKNCNRTDRLDREVSRPPALSADAEPQVRENPHRSP